MPTGAVLAGGSFLSADPLDSGFPLLFEYASDGTPQPDASNCANTSILGHHYANTQELVAKTIEHLNLGCYRLNEQRRLVRARIEKMIEFARENSAGVKSANVRLGLARRLFSSNANSPWPQFFSLLRWRLGQAAEQHLKAIDYNG